MRTKNLLLLISLFSLFFANVTFAQDQKKTETVYFYVDGLNCKNCQARIEKNIAFEKGVTDLKCDLPSKMVAVTYKTDKTNAQKLAKAFDKIKMPAKVVPVDGSTGATAR